MRSAIAEIMSTIAAQGATIIGPCFSYHQKRPTDIFSFEVGFPINQPITPAGRIKMSKWIEAEGFNVQESLWECYLIDPESNPDPDTWRTELNRPLRE
jgi:effector-binding domain-containing protein